MLRLVGKITNMRYQSFLKSPLLTTSFDSDVNDWQSRCCIKDKDTIYAVSKWTEPKRTRTYPFASVYDTLSACGGKTITIIPVVKDEGADSQNMDYLQWDTISLMSLLNVYVILAYYTDAQAQKREIWTTQPKEALSVGIKTPIEIENYLGGKYFLTVDDVIIHNNRYKLIESKHSKKAILPSENDIKDGLVKMMLFSNIAQLYKETDVSSKTLVDFIPILRLTSEKIDGEITTNMNENEITTFFQENCFRKNKEEFVNALFKEARANNFEVIIEYGKREER